MDVISFHKCVYFTPPPFVCVWGGSKCELQRLKYREQSIFAQICGIISNELNKVT